MERNRDFYGNARFDDIAFQLSAEGQALQARFVDSYADSLREGIEDKLVLAPGKQVSKPSISSAADVRGNSKVGTGGGQQARENATPGSVRAEVNAAQQSGRKRIDTIQNYLDGTTKGARGASEDAADDVKKW